MKKVLLSLSLALVIGTVACSTTWVSEAVSIIAALTPAITNIVPLVELADKNVSPADVATIQNYSAQASTALQSVGSLITQYNQATSAAAQQTALSNINAALTVANTNLSMILPQLHITDANTQKDVQAAIAAALAEVGSLEALVPVLKAGQVDKAVALAKPLSADEFRSRYNSAIKPIPGSSKLKLRGPSLVSRVLHRD